MQAADERMRQTFAARERDEKIKSARDATFCRVPLWSFYLPITTRQRVVLGRIYSFQCTTNKDGSQGEYRMSLSNGGNELRIDRRNFKRDIDRLVSLGFVVKRSNGARHPATYTVDEVVCLDEARRNGWEA